jgi:hypothetical protein
MTTAKICGAATAAFGLLWLVAGSGACAARAPNSECAEAFSHFDESMLARDYSAAYEQLKELPAGTTTARAQLAERVLVRWRIIRADQLTTSQPFDRKHKSLLANCGGASPTANLLAAMYVVAYANPQEAQREVGPSFEIAEQRFAPEVAFVRAVLAERLGEFESADMQFEQAVVSGILAPVALGQLLSIGDLVPRNRQRAASWFLRAAKEGDPRAQTEIALMYELGDGLPQDIEQSNYWFERAAENPRAKQDASDQVLTP